MKLFKKIVLILGIIGSILYLLTCLTPYISPVHGYIFSFASLFFPIGFIIMLIWCVLCLVLFKKYAWIFFLLLFAGYKNIFSVYGFHPSKAFVQAKSQNQILFVRTLSPLFSNIFTSREREPLLRRVCHCFCCVP